MGLLRGIVLPSLKDMHSLGWRIPAKSADNPMNFDSLPPSFRTFAIIFDFPSLCFRTFALVFAEPIEFQ